MMNPTIDRRPLMAVLAILSAVALAGCGQSMRVEGERGPDEPIAAAIFRMEQRLSEDGTIPDRALMNAKEQRDALIRRQGLGGGVGSMSWEWRGPGNIGGRVRPIVIHPSQPAIMYIGSASGGIWKTIDAGQSWFPLDDFMPSLSIADMVMHPDDPNTLFACTGEGFFEAPEGSSNTAFLRGAGIFKSVDAGASWQQLPSTDNPDFYFVNRMVIDPGNPNVMIVANLSGIWRTTDGGDSWSQRAVFEALDIQMHPTDAQKLVAGGHHTEDGPYYSTDNGQTWTQASGAGGHRQELAYAPSNPNVVYANVSGDNNRFKVWKSTDGGQTYALMTSGSGIQTWASYNSTLWVDPGDVNYLVVGGVYFYRSTDGGVTFNRRFNAVHADMHRIVPHPDYNGTSNRIGFFATDGGVWQTNDLRGSDAFDLNNNLGITQFYGAGINPTTGHIAGGTQDNGSLSYRGDPQNWDHYFGGDGGYGAADPTDPNYFYGEVQRANIHRSTNGGDSASYIYNTSNPIGDAGGLRTNFIPYFMLDPNNPNTMVVCCRKIWRSTNVKASSPDWFEIKDDIPGGPGPIDPPGSLTGDQSHFDGNDPRNASTCDIANGNSDIIWIGYNNGQVWMTSNGTAGTPTWTRVDENGSTPLPDRWISTICINPSNHNEVYVAVMGWEADNIWKTEDGGQNWINISGSGATAIPAAPASALNIHPTRHGWLYVGTDIGVFTSTDDGGTWNVITDGPGTVPVEQLIWKDSDEMMAVTHGRGIYLATVTPPASLDSLTMIKGTLLDGGVADLGESDNSYVHTRSGFGQTLVDLHNMEMHLSATTSHTTPTTMHLRIESRIDQVSGTAEVRLRNRTSGIFELIGSYPMDQTETSKVFSNIPAANYVDPGTGVLDLSIKHIVHVPFLAFQFESFVDLVEIALE